MSFYNLPIKLLFLEVSSFCNAKCPYCLRESHDGYHYFFNQKNMTLQFIKEHIPIEFISGLEEINIEGVMGDPAANPNLIDIVEYIINVNPNIKILIHSNGGIRNTIWWERLGKTLRPTDEVVFAIDGLEDTNHIYRIGVNWKKLMNNINAFISANGNAVWQFIPFKHNEHQINKAKELSKSLKFSKFITKVSYRFAMNHPKNEKIIIEEPTIEEYRHPKIDMSEKHLDSLDIVCYASNISNSIYITAEGLVYPCCHLGSLKFVPKDHYPDNFINPLKEKNISLFYNKLNDIIESHEFLNVKSSWNKTISTGKTALCSLICGKCDNTDSIAKIRYQDQP